MEKTVDDSFVSAYWGEEDLFMCHENLYRNEFCEDLAVAFPGPFFSEEEYGEMEVGVNIVYPLLFTSGNLLYTQQSTRLLF